MLDVGQGDAILIETPGGRDVLVDGGPGRGGAARARRRAGVERPLDRPRRRHASRSRTTRRACSTCSRATTCGASLRAAPADDSLLARTLAEDVECGGRGAWRSCAPATRSISATASARRALAAGGCRARGQRRERRAATGVRRRQLPAHGRHRGGGGAGARRARRRTGVDGAEGRASRQRDVEHARVPRCGAAVGRRDLVGRGQPLRPPGRRTWSRGSTTTRRSTTRRSAARCTSRPTASGSGSRRDRLARGLSSTIARTDTLSVDLEERAWHVMTGVARTNCAP